MRAPLKQKQNKNLLFSSQNGLYGRPLKVTAESALWESLRPLLPPHGEPPELQQNSRTTSTPTNKNGTRLRYSRFSEHETMKHSMEPSTLFCLAQTKRVVNLGGGDFRPPRNKSATFTFVCCRLRRAHCATTDSRRGSCVSLLASYRRDCLDILCYQTIPKSAITSTCTR